MSTNLQDLEVAELLCELGERLRRDSAPSRASHRKISEATIKLIEERRKRR